MITDFILNAIFAGINALFSLMPSLSLPTFTTSNYENIVAEVNGVFPMYVLIYGLIAVLAIRVGLQAWDFVLYVYHQFWGSD